MFITTMYHFFLSTWVASLSLDLGTPNHTKSYSGLLLPTQLDSFLLLPSRLFTFFVWLWPTNEKNIERKREKGYKAKKQQKDAITSHSRHPFSYHPCTTTPSPSKVHFKGYLSKKDGGVVWCRRIVMLNTGRKKGAYHLMASSE